MPHISNLNSEIKGQAAIRALFRTAHERTGNPPAFPGIFPDQHAPIVRNRADGDRELVMARWGMPGPLQFGGQPVTNNRNVASPHRRGWLPARKPRLPAVLASRANWRYFSATCAQLRPCEWQSLFIPR